MEDFDKALKELQDLVKSESDSEITKEQLLETIQKSKTEDEQIDGILELIKANGGKKVKSSDEEMGGDDDDDEMDDEDMEKGKGKKSYKSSTDDFSDLEMEAINAEPILKSMLDSIGSLNKEIKELKKSRSEDQKVLNQMAKVISGSSSMVKSIKENFDFLGGLPQDLKGKFINLSNEQRELLKKSAVDRFSNESLEKSENKITPIQLSHAMTKAYQDGKISLTDITMEENARFSGVTLSEGNKEIIKSYLSK